MTAEVDLANRALLSIGTRSSIASLTEDSTEARQVSLVFATLRDELLRMAPWGCAKNTATLALLKSAPGTPENPTSSNIWTKAFPPPPWAYEYSYPEDCLRACYIIPQLVSWALSEVPITPVTATTYTNFQGGPAVVFNIAIDQDADGNDMRVILTNQQDAILTYVKRVTDPNVWDPQFQEAFVAALAARLVFSLTGDKGLANIKIGEANTYISLARGGDGNEGLTINNVTPDWLRVRGIQYGWDGIGLPYGSFDWGPLLPLF